MQEVFIQLIGDKMGGRYEVKQMPPIISQGFIEAWKIKKGDGTKRYQLINITSVARIESASEKAGEFDMAEIPE